MNMTSLFSKGNEGTMWATKVGPIEDKDGEKDDDNNFHEEVKEFGAIVTLHGIRYVSDYNMHILRR